MHTDFPLVKLIIHRAQGGGPRVFKANDPAHLPPLPGKKKTLMYLLLIRLAFFVNVILSKKKTFKMLTLNLLLLPKAQNFDHWSNYSTKIHTTL